MIVRVSNRQRTVDLDLARLTSLAEQAVSACWCTKGVANGSALSLDAVEVSLVSDRRIAALHRQFLDVAGPTDVITFEHGEIVVSAETAARAALAHDESLERELCRYIVHGLLHLRGFEDATLSARAAMWRVQERLVRRLCPGRGSQAAQCGQTHRPPLK